jgi:hypothetical protein
MPRCHPMQGGDWSICTCRLMGMGGPAEAPAGVASSEAEGDRWTRMSRLLGTKKATRGGEGVARCGSSRRRDRLHGSPRGHEGSGTSHRMCRRMWIEEAVGAVAWVASWVRRKRHEPPHVSPDVDRGGDGSSCMGRLMGTKEAARASACVAGCGRRGDGSRTMGPLTQTKEATSAIACVAPSQRPGQPIADGGIVSIGASAYWLNETATDSLTLVTLVTAVNTSRRQRSPRC